MSYEVVMISSDCQRQAYHIKTSFQHKIPTVKLRYGSSTATNKELPKLQVTETSDSIENHDSALFIGLS